MVMNEEDDLLTMKAVISKWMYMVYQSQGLKGTNFSDEILLKRVSGFEHPEQMIYKPEFFIGIDHKDYRSESRIALTSLYYSIKEKEAKLIEAKNNTGRYKTKKEKHNGLKDFTSSLTNEELERLGAKSLEDKQYWLKRLAREYFYHLTNNVGVNAVMQPHCYKEPNSDCHIQFSRFDKNGNVFSDWKLHTRMRKTLVYMHIKYPELIPPPAIAEEVKRGIARNISNSNASVISKETLLDISNEILNSDAKYVSEFYSNIVSLNIITKAGYSKCVDRKNNIYEQSKRRVSGISIEYKGAEFYSNKLSALADRKIQLMTLAERLRDDLDFDIYELKEKILEIQNSSSSYEEFCDKCIESNVKVLPVFQTDKGTGTQKFSGFHLKHTGIKENIKISLFDIDLLKRFDIDMNDEAHKHRVLNKSIEHVESFASFTSTDLKFKKGQSLSAYLADMRNKNKSLYIMKFTQKGDEFYFGKSTHKSFDMNMNAGTAILYKTGFSEVNAVADLYIKRGTTQVIMNNPGSQKNLEMTYLTFGKKGIEILSDYVTPQLKAKLNFETEALAVNKHIREKDNIFKAISLGKRSINTQPLIAENGVILSYENIWLILNECAVSEIELTKVPSEAFVNNEDYLKKRFSDNPVTLNYIKQRIDRVSLSADDKVKEYVRLTSAKWKNK
ncbi:hypothetical protein PFUM301597_37790 [Pseudomonas fluorescens]